MMSITILQVKKGLMTKHFRPEGKVDYGNSKWFSHYDVDANNITDLSKVLEDLEGISSATIIRGKLFNDVTNPDKILPREDAYDGERAYFRENPNGVPWVMLDFDKIPAKPGLATSDERIEYLISLLPDYLQNVSYHWQWSSSAGIEGWDLLSCHIWMWLSVPRLDKNMMAWADGLDVIDEAVMRTVQPHYTAAPIFEGVSDPVEVRSGLVIQKNASAHIPIIPVVDEGYMPSYVPGAIGPVRTNNKTFEDELCPKVGDDVIRRRFGFA